jgi:hypothetical protein
MAHEAAFPPCFPCSSKTRRLPKLPCISDLLAGLIPQKVGGQVFTDDHFSTERAWTRTALPWRRAYAARR